ncbi:MAG TPA: hypothetical protein VGG75_38630 [Trebonia sp.]
MRYTNGTGTHTDRHEETAPLAKADTGIKRAIGISIFLLTFLVVGLAYAAVANAATATATPAQRTCAAFATWDHKRTTANLNTMMTVSESAPWKYTGEDAAGLYSDVRSGAAAKYVTEDVKYFGEDCS